jgi:hypothetical protein
MRQWFRNILLGLKIIVSSARAEYYNALKEWDIASGYVQDIEDKVLKSLKIGKPYVLTVADHLSYDRKDKARKRLIEAKKRYNNKR